jgi:thiol-disulfide isomerase/thioredoxin
MLALPRPFRLAALGMIASVALAGCAREGLGAETAGRTTVTTAKGFNVSLIPEGKRRPMPRFSGEALAGGGRISQSFLAGHVSVVNVWGSWCGPCRREQPLLEEIWKRYRPKGVRFLGIDVREGSKANGLAFIREFGVTYPSVYDPASAVAYRFRVIFAPATYVIDARGRIAAKIVGAIRAPEDLTTILDVELGGA